MCMKNDIVVMILLVKDEQIWIVLYDYKIPLNSMLINTKDLKKLTPTIYRGLSGEGCEDFQEIGVFSKSGYPLELGELISSVLYEFQTVLMFPLFTSNN